MWALFSQLFSTCFGGLRLLSCLGFDEKLAHWAPSEPRFQCMPWALSVE